MIHPDEIASDRGHDEIAQRADEAAVAEMSKAGFGVDAINELIAISRTLKGIAEGAIAVSLEPDSRRKIADASRLARDLLTTYHVTYRRIEQKMIEEAMA